MPNIRGIYYSHPDTGVLGLWVMRRDGSVLGRTDAQLAAFVGTGNTATRMARFKAAAEAYLNAGLEHRTPQSQFFADWTAQEIADWSASPPQFYRLDGADVVAQASVATIEVLSLTPLRWQITISEGASRNVTAYGS